MAAQVKTSLSEYVARHSKTHVIFDLDATLLLIHFAWEHWGEGMRDTLRAIDPELWELWATHHNTAAMQNKYVEQYGDAALKIVVDYAHEFERVYNGFSKNEELQEELRSLGPNIKRFLWSSNTRPVVETVLGESGLLQHFDKLVTRNDVRLLKPSSEGFERHIYDAKIPLEKYVMVGDSPFDREAAQKAGIDFYHIDFFAGQ